MMVEAKGLDHIHHGHQVSLRLRALEEPAGLYPIQGGQGEVSEELGESDQRRGNPSSPNC